MLLSMRMIRIIPEHLPRSQESGRIDILPLQAAEKQRQTPFAHGTPQRNQNESIEVIIMKTLQEFYKEIIADDELKKAFAEAAKENKVIEFAKEHGVEATIDDIKAFLEEQRTQEKELSPEELENAAGGTCNGQTAGEAAVSVATLLGCAMWFFMSNIESDSGYAHNGQWTDTDGRLCTVDGGDKSKRNKK